MKLLRWLRGVSFSLSAPKIVAWLLPAVQCPISPGGVVVLLPASGPGTLLHHTPTHLLSGAGSCGGAHPSPPGSKEWEGIAGDSSPLREKRAILTCLTPGLASLTPSSLRPWIDHTIKLHVSTWHSPGLDPSKPPCSWPDRNS